MLYNFTFSKIWKLQRDSISHFLSSPNFCEMVCKVFEKKTRILIKILQESAKNGNVINLQDLFYKFTLDSIGK